MAPFWARAQNGSPRPDKAAEVREAQQALQEARTLMASPTVEARRLAIATLQRAVRLFEAAGDQAQRLNALGSLGEVYNRLGESHQAIDVYVTILALAREIVTEPPKRSPCKTSGWNIPISVSTRRPWSIYRNR